MKTMIWTFVGCVDISIQTWTFAHLTTSCLHKCGCLHIWGRRVCARVVACTFVVVSTFHGSTRDFSWLCWVMGSVCKAPGFTSLSVSSAQDGRGGGGGGGGHPHTIPAVRWGQQAAIFIAKSNVTFQSQSKTQSTNIHWASDKRNLSLL